MLNIKPKVVCKNTEISYLSHRDKTHKEKKCLAVYEEEDLKDTHTKFDKLSQIAKDLQSEHDDLIDQGLEIGDEKLDIVEAQLEAVLDELLKFQIDIDKECQSNKAKLPCEQMPKCVWLEQKFSWLKFWASKKGLCTSSVKSAILEEQYKEGADQLTEIVNKLEILEKKSRLKAEEKQKLRYLHHLKKELLEAVQKIEKY